MVMMLLLKLWIKCSRKLSLPIWEAVFCGKQVFLVFPPPPFRTVLISERTWKGPCCEASLLWSLGFGSWLEARSRTWLLVVISLQLGLPRSEQQKLSWKWHCCVSLCHWYFCSAFQAASFQWRCLFGLRSELYCMLLISKWCLEGWVEHYPPCLISHIWYRSPEISCNI